VRDCSYHQPHSCGYRLISRIFCKMVDRTNNFRKDLWPFWAMKTEAAMLQPHHVPKPSISHPGCCNERSGCISELCIIVSACMNIEGLMHRPACTASNMSVGFDLERSGYACDQGAASTCGAIRSTATFNHRHLKLAGPQKYRLFLASFLQDHNPGMDHSPALLRSS
jgi:hypothetical protein